MGTRNNAELPLCLLIFRLPAFGLENTVQAAVFNDLSVQQLSMKGRGLRVQFSREISCFLRIQPTFLVYVQSRRLWRGLI